MTYSTASGGAASGEHRIGSVAAAEAAALADYPDGGVAAAQTTTITQVITSEGRVRYILQGQGDLPRESAYGMIRAVAQALADRADGVL